MPTPRRQDIASDRRLSHNLITAMTDEVCRQLQALHGGRYPVAELSYGTVRDYCDSCDHLPWLSSIQNDLKDLQRPWTVKAALGLLSPGASLLEIGAGQPFVAAALAEFGYRVTVVDPYDGSGGGPTEFDQFVQAYPKVRIIRNEFRPGLLELADQIFDGIYSVSVLEHIPEPFLGTLFEGVTRHLRREGWSFHSVDCVTQGAHAAYHCEQCIRIANYQDTIAGREAVSKEALVDLINRASSDVETYYLSAAGHNLWRGSIPYDEFPFRKVISVQLAAQRMRRKSGLTPL